MKKTLIITLISLVTICIIVLGYLYFKSSNDINYILNANVEALDKTSFYVKDSVIKDNDSIIAEKQKALLYDENQKLEITYNYYIITGSFKKQENAEKQKDLLKTKGFSPNIIRSDFEHYKVSIFSSPDKSVALDSLENLKLQEEFKTAWLLKKRR